MTDNDRKDLVEGLTEIIEQYTMERSQTTDQERIDAFNRLIDSLSKSVERLTATA